MALEDLLTTGKRPFALLQGVVTTTALPPNPPNYPFSYCGVEVGGAAGETLGVRFMGGYYPVIGDTVYLAWFGTDGFILGKLVNSLSTPGIDTRVYRVTDWNTVAGASSFTFDNVEYDQAAVITVGAPVVGGVPVIDSIVTPNTIQGVTTIGHPQAIAVATVGTNPNLMSTAQAGAETAATWVAGGGVAAGATSSTDFARTGTHSWKVVSNGTAINSTTATRVTGMTAGSGYDIEAYSRATVAARNTFLFVQWYNSGGAVVGSQTFTSNVTGDTTGFTSKPFKVNIVAPATATQVDFFLGFGTQNGANLPNLEACYFDDLKITLTGSGTTGSGSGGGINSLARVIQSMDGGAHESTLEGIPAFISWSTGPELVTASPGANTALTYYGYIWLDGSRISTASNTRVAIRFAESYVLLASTSLWSRCQADVIPTGQRYTEDLQTNTDWSGFSRAETDGSVSFRMSSGFAIQFYGTARAGITPADVVASFATIQASLILENPNGVDDRVNANVLVAVGLDWWDTPTGTNRQEMGLGRFQYVPRDGSWAAFNVWNGPADLAAEFAPDGSGGYQTPWSQGQINWRTTGSINYSQINATPPPMNAMSGGVSGGGIAHPVTIQCVTSVRVPGIVATSGGGQQGGVAKLISDMVDNNSSFPNGVPPSYSFYPGPELDNPTPPGGFTSAIVWGVVWYDANRPTTSTNTRVEVADCVLYLWEINRNAWAPYQLGPAPTGGHYQEPQGSAPFANINKSANLRSEPAENGVSDVMEPDYWFHFWCQGSRATINPANIGGAVAWFRTRLIKDNPAGADDRANCHLVAAAGGDWWLSTSADWPNNAQMFYARFLPIPTDGSWIWCTGNTWTRSATWGNPPNNKPGDSGARIGANPPPFPG